MSHYTTFKECGVDPGEKRDCKENKSIRELRSETIRKFSLLTNEARDKAIAMFEDALANKKDAPPAATDESVNTGTEVPQTFNYCNTVDPVLQVKRGV